MDTQLDESRNLRGTYGMPDVPVYIRTVFGKSSKTWLSVVAERSTFSTKGITDPNDTFYIISKKRQAFQNLASALGRGEVYDAQQGTYMSEDKYSMGMYMYSALGHITLSVDSSDHANIVDYLKSGKADDFFNISVVKGVAKLHQYLVVKKQLTDDTFTRLIGADTNEIRKDGWEAVGSFKVFWKPSMRKSIKEQFVANLTKAEKILNRYGLGHLCDVAVDIGKIDSNTVGLYFSKTDRIRLDSGFANNRDSVYVLIHELGHRLHLTNSNIDKLVMAKHQEILGTMSDKKVRLVDGALSKYGEALYEELSRPEYQQDYETAERGLVDVNDYFDKSYLIYKGRAKSKFLLSDGTKLLPLALGYSGNYQIHMMSEKAIIRSEAKPYTLRANISYPFNPKSGSYLLHMSPRLKQSFEKIAGKSMPNVIDLNFKSLLKNYLPQDMGDGYKFSNGRIVHRDKWFVSDYAQTNYKEFFAELFAYYIIGTLKGGEPKEWIKSIIKMG